jgi:diguanylate cyclase (GGDEF)-like protein
VVDGRPAQPAELSPDERANAFFEPTFALEPGEVHQSKPYVSPDTGNWVVANATVVTTVGGRRALIHFEVRLDSLRTKEHNGLVTQIIDAGTGAVVSDSRRVQGGDKPLGVPENIDYRSWALGPNHAGMATIAGRRTALQPVATPATNANHWFVAVSALPVHPTWWSDFGIQGFVLLALALLMLTFATLALRAYQRRLRTAALTDALTGLPNRNLFLDRANQALAAGRRHGTSTALLLIDLDRFKEINDTVGHQSGDGLLAAIGPRIKEQLRAVDTVARLGGDEFAVLVTDLMAVTDALAIAQKISNVLKEPFQVGSIQLDIEASIGIAVAPQHADTVEQLFQRADVAMYVAKQTHVGAALYDQAHDTYNPRRLATLGELRRAVECDELILHFQPKIAVQDSHVVGVEALVRWMHPERGLVLPDEFIPIAEHTALMQPLTSRIIDLALAQSRAWLDDGRAIPIAVNISARSLLDDNFADRVIAKLDAWSVPAHLLTLEVTETAIMTDPDRARRLLARLNEYGVRLAIDDFGTGYSSLAYLRTLPVHELKIDRTFVQQMHDNVSDAVIVKSVIDLGRNLGLQVVAEGVETASTLNALVDLGCDVGQGFFWDPARPAAQLSFAYLDEPAHT